MKFIDYFKTWRVILWIICVVLMLVAIQPSLSSRGVLLRSIDPGSTAELNGILNPSAKTSLTQREFIYQVNEVEVNSPEQFYEVTSKLEAGKAVRLKTSINTYTFLVEPLIEIENLNQTEMVNITTEIFDNLTNSTRTITNLELVNKTRENIVGIQDLGIHVSTRPTTNIRKGLDLQGGTRVLLSPSEPLSEDNMSFVVENLAQRLNVFGLSDVTVRAVNDLPAALGGSGKQFILVEVAGASKSDIEQLLAKQGKFEATISNQSVFAGGSEDITYVCMDATCSGIDPTVGCGQTDTGYSCRFMFSISVSPAAASRFSAITKNIPIDSTSNGQYLTEKIFLILDDVEKDQLAISTGLRGREETNIQISGSGVGTSLQSAREDAIVNMKQLQTLLKTGSLPVKLDIVSSQSVSAKLGEHFVKNSIIVAFLSALGVALVLYLRYQNIKLTLVIVTISFSEIILLLGLAALIGWNIDVAAIAGIIIAIGTGVNHQIVITDEILYKEQEYYYDWTSRIKVALSIIMVSYATTLVAMVPLLFAGAGLLKGFALITILGEGLGVFISRPAFAAIADKMLKER